MDTQAVVQFFRTVASPPAGQGDSLAYDMAYLLSVLAECAIAATVLSLVVYRVSRGVLRAPALRGVWARLWSGFQFLHLYKLIIPIASLAMTVSIWVSIPR